MRIKRSKISSYKLKKIITHFVIDINASKTSLLTGINRNTVNRFYHIFRKVIYQEQLQLFKEKLHKRTVECDEAYFGGKRKRGVPGKRGRGTNKQPVFGIFERDGKVYTEIVNNCTKPTLQAIIRGKIDPKTIIVTDKWRGYDGLVDVGYDAHYRINHSKAFSNGHGVHINGIENFWSFTKRRLHKFSNGVKPNFPYHLKECEWRYKKSKPQMIKELIYLLKKFRRIY